MSAAAVAIVIVEPGTVWPHIDLSWASSIVLSEDPNESAASLAARIAHRLRLDAVGADRIELAVLACSEGAQHWRLGRRLQISRELLCALRGGGGRLVLWASSVAPPDLRLQLLAVAGQLVIEGPPRAKGPVAVRFGVRDRFGRDVTKSALRLSAASD